MLNSLVKYSKHIDNKHWGQHSGINVGKLLGSPKKAGSPRKPGGGSPTKSPEKARNPRFPMNKDQPEKITTKGINPYLMT